MKKNALKPMSLLKRMKVKIMNDKVRQLKIHLKDRIVTCLLLMMSGFATSCAYHWGYDDVIPRHSTLSIPYVEGDLNGELTNEVIKQISSSGAFQYVNDCGAFTLKIKIIELKDRDIGFRYDRYQDGRLKHAIVPTETRQTEIVEVSLVDSQNDKVIKGPIIISAETDFDHTFYTSRNEINVFSLAQVGNIDAARESSIIPLNRKLAAKIVDYVTQNWNP